MRTCRLCIVMMVLAFGCDSTTNGEADSGMTTPAIDGSSGSDTDAATSGGGMTPGSETPAASVVRNLVEQYMLPLHRRIDESAATLETALQTYAMTQNDANRMTAQQAYIDTITLWQEAEMLRFGPAGPASLFVAGQDMAEEIYSWPRSNPCRVDQEIVSQGYLDTDAFASARVNIRGLDALEYLLFTEGTGNACTDAAVINRDGLWITDEATLVARRAAYAYTLGRLVRTRIAALRSAWEPAEGGFATQLTTAGEEGSMFTSPIHALSEMAGGLYAIDTQVKDRKLGEVIGMGLCTATSCPENLESQHAGQSGTYLSTNLRAFQTMFLGAAPGMDAPGMDDLLNAAGTEGEALSASMDSNLTTAISQVDAVDANLATTLSSDASALTALHTTIQSIASDFKNELARILALDIPVMGGGDSD